jgi:hypothetical protein
MLQRSQLDKKFDEVVYFVKASFDESLFLWNELHTKLDWKEYNRGLVYTIGEINDRPINVEFNFCYINNKLICFYDCISQLCDYKMLEDWLDTTFPNVPDTNAMNFHHAVHSVYGKVFWPHYPIQPDDIYDLLRRSEDAKDHIVIGYLKSIRDILEGRKNAKIPQKNVYS